MRKHAEAHESDTQEYERHKLRAAHVAVRVELLVRRAEEHLGEKPQHIERREDDAGDGEHRENRELGEYADEDRELRHEADESRQSQGRHAREHEARRKARHLVGKPLEIVHCAKMRLFIDEADHREEERAHHAVRHHVGNRARDADDIQCREAQEHIAHVRHRRVADDVLQILLHERDVSGIEHVAHREERDQWRPELRAQRQHEKPDADEAVAADLLQNARMNHRHRRRCARVAVGRPAVEREHGKQRAEADEEQ